MKFREMVFVAFIAFVAVFVSSWLGCSWFQGGESLPDPNSDEVQKACVVACTAFRWTACDDERSLDQYLPVGQMVQAAETIEECSKECIRLSDHITQDTIECLAEVSSCDGAFACFEL